MFFEKRKYRVRKYKKCPFEKYEPEPRLDFHKEHAIPVFIRICHHFALIGGMLSIFASSILMGVKGIFGFKESMRQVSDKYRIRKARIVEVRV